MKITDLVVGQTIFSVSCFDPDVPPVLIEEEVLSINQDRVFIAGKHFSDEKTIIEVHQAELENWYFTNKNDAEIDRQLAYEDWREMQDY